MMVKKSTAPITSNTPRVKVSVENEIPSVGIVKCGDCGGVYLSSHGKCPNCSKG